MYNIKQIRAQGGTGGGKAAGVQSIYTGAKPELPNRFYFQSLIVPPDEPVYVDSRYVKESMRLPMQGLTLIVIGGLLIWGWLSLPLRFWTKLGLSLTLALVFAAIRTLAEGDYATQLSSIIYCIVIVTVACVAYDAAQWIKAKRAARSEEPEPTEPEE